MELQVLPVGPESAEVMLILDSATEEDAKTRQAFSGKYTGEIKTFCREAGIDYFSSYRTLFIKEKLSYGGKSKKQKGAAIQEAYKNFNYAEILTNEIKLIKPRVIIPLGELAFNFTTGQKSISKYRGSILPLRFDLQSRVESNSIRVVPTLGPEYIFANYRHKVYVQLDYKKAALQRNATGPVIDPTVVWIADTPEKFNNYRSRYPNPKFGVFDIETKFNIPVCIGFCLSPNEAVCVPLVDETIPKHILLMLWTMVDNLLRNGPAWVNQNIKFDWRRLQWMGFQVQNIIGDTALRANNIYPELPKNLGFLNSIYTDFPYHKDEGKDSPNREVLYKYCAKDCLTTYHIYDKQEDEIKDLGLGEYDKKQWELFWPYVKIEQRGLLIDNERKQRLFNYYFIEYEIHRALLDKLANRHINPHSPKQVAVLLYDQLGLPLRKDHVTGALKTDEDTLEEHIVFNAKDFTTKNILELVEACRKLHKLLEFFSAPVHPDDRLRTSYDLGGTKNGRTSTKTTTDYYLQRDQKGKWELQECGRPLQTIGKHGFKIKEKWYGKDLRSIFVPTPGYVFVEGDLSQAEARVDAVLAKDFSFLDRFDTKPGIHCLTASWIYSCDPNEIKKGSAEYFIGKTARHAGERGMGVDRFAAMIREPIEFCKETLDTFHATQPNIRKVFHKEVTEHVRKFRNLVSPHGHRRDFFGKPDHEMDMEAISDLPQATVSKQIQYSIPLLESEIPNTRLVYEGHDALMAEIRKENLGEYAKIFKRIVERPIDFRNCSLPRDIDLVIPCEISWSETNWQDMEDFHAE